MKVAIHVRVSTAGQTQRYGLDAQKRILLTYANSAVGSMSCTRTRASPARLSRLAPP